MIRTEPSGSSRNPASGDGHGISEETLGLGRAHFHFDAPSGSVRIIVVSTAAETGAADGVVHQADVDGWLRDALDDAEADGRWVIVATHHGASSLTDGGGLGGVVQDDAVTPEAWAELLGSYPNVILHLAGHSHEHAVNLIEPEVGHPYWELKTAAIADHPHQMRGRYRFSDQRTAMASRSC